MRADRLLAMLMLLQSKGRMTAVELAGELEVSERTIYRDVTALGISGVPIYTEPGPGGGISLIESYRSDLTGLTTDEVRALFMLSIPSPLSDLGLDGNLKAALRKLSAALPGALKGQEQRVRQRMHIDSDTWEKRDEPLPHLLTVQQAVWGDQQLAIQYRSFLGSRVGPLEALVEPYGLVAKEGVWYLVGKREDHIAVLRIDWLLEAEILGDVFERPSDFDLVSFWTSWCADNQERRPRFTVTALVAPGLLPYLPTALGKAIGVEIKEVGVGEGDGRITLHLSFETFEEARSRILAFGQAIEVVEPLSLRLSVIDYARQITDLYASGETRII